MREQERYSHMSKRASSLRYSTSTIIPHKSARVPYSIASKASSGPRVWTMTVMTPMTIALRGENEREKGRTSERKLDVRARALRNKNERKKETDCVIALTGAEKGPSCPGGWVSTSSEQRRSDGMHCSQRENKIGLTLTQRCGQWGRSPIAPSQSAAKR